MRFTFIEISNYLSYGTTKQRVDFDNNLTMLIGPNGGGKTNILRSIDTVLRVIEEKVLRQYNNIIEVRLRSEQRYQPHFSYSNQPTEIQLGVDFSDEKEVIKDFIHAAIMSDMKEAFSSSGQQNPTLEAKNDCVQKALQVEVPDWFIKGTIVVSHTTKRSDNWQLSYKFSDENHTFELLLPNNTLTSHENGSISSYQNRSISSFLATKLIANSDVPSFLELISEKDDEYIDVSIQPSNFNILSSPSNDTFVNFLSHLESYSWYNQYNMMYTLGLHDVLYSILTAKLFSDSENSSLGNMLTVTAKSLAYVASNIMQAGELEIPKYLNTLYRWQNGNKEERIRFTEAKEIFSKLRPGEQFGIRLTPITPNPMLITNRLQPPEANTTTVEKNDNLLFLLIPFVEKDVEKDTKEMSASMASSGAVELMRLSTLLASAKDSVVILDEPTARLHPMMQKHFGQYLYDAKAQYIVVSHAPGLFPKKSGEDNSHVTVKRIALDHKSESLVSSFQFLRDKTQKNCLVKSKLIDDLTEKIHNEIQKNPQVHQIFFAEKLVLVSGESELVAYQNWYYKLQQNSDNKMQTILHFHSFGGDNHLDVSLGIAMMIGIPWIAFLDGGSYAPNGALEINNGPIKVPLIVGQLATAAELANDENILDKIKDIAPKIEYKENKTSPIELEVKNFLEELGIYTFANCYNTEKLKDPCPVCEKNKIQKNQIPNDREEGNNNQFHIESFEDFYSIEFLEFQASSENKIEQARKVSEEQKCPKQIENILQDFIEKNR